MNYYMMYSSYVNQVCLEMEFGQPILNCWGREKDVPVSFPLCSSAVPNKTNLLFQILHCSEQPPLANGQIMTA